MNWEDEGYIVNKTRFRENAIAGRGNDLLKNPDVGRLFLGG